MRRLLPFIIIAALALGWLMVSLKAAPPKKPSRPDTPFVEVLNVERGDLVMDLYSQGTVKSQYVVEQASEVNGRVLWVSPAFVQGGMVDEGQLLLRIDPIDYPVALAEAKNGLATAELSLAEEQACFHRAARDWAIISDEPANDFTLRKPHLVQAEANLESAREVLRKAERDLGNTEIRAPFNAIVDSKHVDPGQYLTVASPVATLFSTDVAEVRLPLNAADINFISPLFEGDDIDGAELNKEGEAPKVKFSAEFSTQQQHWHGRLSRVEHRVDADTRVFYAVAEVKQPYRYQPPAMPLSIGLYVDALIEGVTIPDVSKIPRMALHDENSVFVLVDGHLQRRQVEIIRWDMGYVIVGNGLSTGDQLVLTRLDLMVDGMAVQVLP